MNRVASGLTRSISQSLANALARLGRVREPSVADLLRKHNYPVEAEVVQNIIDEMNYR